MYSEGAEDEKLPARVQESDADGRLTFTSIFPACYAGRWPTSTSRSTRTSIRPPAVVADRHVTAGVSR